jgi:hypothetical protein
MLRPTSNPLLLMDSNNEQLLGVVLCCIVLCCFVLQLSDLVSQQPTETQLMQVGECVCVWGGGIGCGMIKAPFLHSNQAVFAQGR